MRLVTDHDVAGGYVDALQEAESVTVDRAVDLFGERVPDTEIIAYAEEHDMVVFTGDQRFLYDDESGESPPPPIAADCGVIFYRQTRFLRRETSSRRSSRSPTIIRTTALFENTSPDERERE